MTSPTKEPHGSDLMSSATEDESGAPIEDQSLGSIVSRISNDFSQLVRQEITLAKLELKEEGKKAGQAAGMLGGAALGGWMTLLFASATLMWLLDKAMDLTLAALIVTVLWAIVTAVLGILGRRRVQAVDPKPEQTIETIKEDAAWLRAQKK